MDPSVTTLLKKHSDYFQEQDNGRIVCTLNNHSLPASRQALETFVKGQLYCSLTCQVMQAKLDTVKKHMSGKRFTAAKAEFEEDKRELMEEPDVDDSANSEEADQDADVELSHNVQDDSASPMEEDTLPDAACPVISPNQVQLSPDHTDAALAAEAVSKAGRKRKQQDSSTHQLPRSRGKSNKRKAKQLNGT